MVGAGVAGLCCAAALSDAGVRVTVLDGAQAAGGRARSWADAETGVDVDIGPHVLSTEHRNFLALLERLGTAGDVLWQRQPLIRLLDAQGRIDMANSTWPPPLHGLPNLPRALRRLSVADLLSHWRIGWAAARLDDASVRALDGEDMLACLRRMGVSERAISWFWRSAVLALLNVPLEQCSAAAAMRVFRLMEGRSGFHFGLPKVGLSDLYVPGCREAVRRAGGELRLGTGVRALRAEGGALQAVLLDDGSELAASHCVLAVPSAELAAVVERSGLAALEPLARAARRFEPSPYVSTMVWFDRPLATEAFWARTWSPADLNTDFYDLARIRPALAGGPSLVASNAIGPLARTEWDDARIVAQTVREIAQFAPDAHTARVRHARVHRIAMAIPQPRPGTETVRPGTRTMLEGLWLAGDWTDTAIPCSMESAARSGALAAQAVLDGLGRPARLAIDPPETYGLCGLVRRLVPASPCPQLPVPHP